MQRGVTDKVCLRRRVDSTSACEPMQRPVFSPGTGAVRVKARFPSLSRMFFVFFPSDSARKTS